MLSAIPIGRGEQLIITSNPDASSSHRTIGSSSSNTAPAPESAAKDAVPTPPPSVKAINAVLSAPSPHISTPAQTVTPPSAPKPQTPSSTGDAVALPGRDAGHLVLRVVPDDNSCLFSAIGVVFEGGIEAAQRLRKVVVDEIRRDPDSWSEVILGYVCSVVSPVLDES